jgi:hypothetical protein
MVFPSYHGLIPAPGDGSAGHLEPMERPETSCHLGFSMPSVCILLCGSTPFLFPILQGIVYAGTSGGRLSYRGSKDGLTHIW